MKESKHTRRSYLKGIGATVLATGSLTGMASAAEWTVAETPTDGKLYDVAYTANGAYAVGQGGVVLERADGSWTKVLGGGPTGNGNDLYGASVTDDGERLWFSGASGAVGEYDVTTGSLYDHSHPLDSGNNFNDIAVTGPAGDANVYVAGDSGKVFYSFENGESETWNYTTPGSGAGLSAIDFFDDRKGHVVDTNQKVFRTDDGETWDVIGIANANVNFYGVDSDAFDDVTVSGGNGMVFEWDGAEWTPTDLGDASLRDIEIAGGNGYTVGGGGKVFSLTDGVWSADATPTGANLKAVVRGSPDIAVGAGGTVIEK